MALAGLPQGATGSIVVTNAGSKRTWSRQLRPTTANAVDSVRRHGGIDYLEKPLDEARLLAAVGEGVDWSARKRQQLARTATLSPREREVFDLLVQGHSNKVIAAMLELSPKTVEDHRASIMSKTGANGLAQLIALAALD